MDAQDLRQPSGLRVFSDHFPIEPDRLGCLRQPFCCYSLLQGVDDRSASLASSLPILPEFGRQDLFWRDHDGVQGFGERFSIQDDYVAGLGAPALP
jgi:hypothetical protein